MATAEGRINALILAGGRSSRLGQAKAALPFGAGAILERMLATLLPVAEEIIVVAAPAADETFPIGELLGDLRKSVKLLRDEAPFAGPVPALIRGLSAARNSIVFACSCDLPLLRAEVAGTLCSMIGDFDVAVPAIEGRYQPLCAAYRKEAADRIDALWRGGQRRLTTIVEQLKHRQVTEDELRRVDPDLRSFLNINTREDYRRALALAKLMD